VTRSRSTPYGTDECGTEQATVRERALRHPNREEERMQWTKPEFEIVEVTMEVTAYVARR